MYVQRGKGALKGSSQRALLFLSRKCSAMNGKFPIMPEQKVTTYTTGIGFAGEFIGSTHLTPLGAYVA